MTRKGNLGIGVALLLLLAVPVEVQSAQSDPLDNWHVRNYLPTNEGIHAITFGNGMYAAVGGSGSIRTSRNGTVWTTRPPVATDDLTDIVFGKGIFVAVGGSYAGERSRNGTVVTSADGITWTQRTSATNSVLQRVTFGDGQFVAVGLNGTIITSNDGIAWNQRNSSTKAYLYGVAFGKGTFVAVGSAGTIVTSPDGINWTTESSPTAGSFHAVTFGNNIFVATDWAGGIYASSDGFAWTTMASLSRDLPCVTFGNETFVATNGNGGFASKDGVSWVPVSYTLSAVAFADGVFIGIGSGSSVHTSLDGVTWTEKWSPLIATFRSIGYVQDRFVAADSNSGRIFTSPDGITWARQESPGAGYGCALGNAAFGNNTFVRAQSWPAVVYTSPDCEVWTERSLPDIKAPIGGLINQGFSDITFGGNIFVGVGYFGVILTSPDGITWTQRESPTTHSLLKVAFGDGTFVAVGQDGAIVTSLDGINWTKGRVPSGNIQLFDVAFGNSTFVAVGEGIVSSHDGSAWTQRIPDPGYVMLEGVAYGNNTFVAVGSLKGIILQSDPVAGDLQTLTVSALEGGTVASTRPGINCSSDCTETYFQNTEVTLIAKPKSGLSFKGWEGCDIPDINDVNQCAMIMSESKAVTALFESGPSLVIKTPKDDGRPVTTAMILVSGTATDSGRGESGITSVAVNGQASVNDTAPAKARASWTITIPLGLGENTISVVATDGKGNTTTATRAVTRLADDSGPSLTVRTPKANQKVTMGTVTVSGTASDSRTGGNGIASVTVNGERADNDTAEGKATVRWSKTVTLNPDADTITVVATDGLGKETRKTITFRRP